MLTSIKSKVLISYLGIIFIVALVLIVSSYWYMVRSLEEIQRGRLESIALHEAEEITEQIYGRAALMERMAGSREFEAYHEKYRDADLVKYLSMFSEEFPVLSYAGKDGREAVKIVKGGISGTPSQIGRDAFFKNALSKPNKPVIAAIKKSPELNGPVVRMALARYLYFGDRFAGMLIGQIPLSHITGEISKTKIDKTGFVTLVDNEGTVLASPRESRVREKVDMQGKEAGDILRNIKALSPGFGRAVLHGTDGFVAYAPVPVTGWSVIAVLPYEDFISGPNKLRNISLAVFFGICVVGGAFSFALAGSITHPLIKLTKIADGISKGDLPGRMEIESRGEVGRLIASFNRMVGNLKMSQDSLLSTIQELSHAEDFIRNILESVAEGFIVIDREYRIITANRAYSAQVNLPAEEVKGRHCYEVSRHADIPCHERGEECPVKYTFDTGMPRTAVHSHCDRKGNRLFMEVRSYPVRNAAGDLLSVIEILSDITEKKTLEDQVRQSQKMEAIGRLVAGIAHEINNPLTNASLNIETLRSRAQYIGADEGFLQKISAIEKNIDRASVIAKELLEFSRQREPEVMPLDINGTIANALAFMEYKLGDITVRRDLEEAPVVAGDPVRLEQVFINVLNNSVEAMPEGGDIFISTLVSHDCIEVRISDTGSGIPEENLSRVFDPFFTTKELGAGAGLGLPICYGIVNQHKGEIKITSTVGRGTTVIIELPCFREQVPSK